VYDFRTSVIMHGPIADAVPSTPTRLHPKACSGSTCTGCPTPRVQLCQQAREYLGLQPQPGTAGAAAGSARADDLSILP
ncbi:MAG: hypothetical protein M3Y33_06075, partial [Actinomycetota bacterium]|nr:hypothetical protein [Actinomycetota bacterium]